MTDLTSNAAYTKRFNTVLTYIEANLEGDLSVTTLSRVANFSAFHFHRQLTAFVGVSVARSVQLMRLRSAAHCLSSPGITRCWKPRSVQVMNGHFQFNLYKSIN
ncbi:AraC family transcriptional regulator [Pseudomonas fluorescens]|uniref:AraC family transcriptional regulator n=1 Tax=Pseudomonas fluorescens TaxID=294 RepID=A0A379I965_PSEFL|nr:AraC family transcriptional regulator [Pseudomonas fluorescens]